MYTIIWKYKILEEHEAAFVAAYGADGEWVRLFRKGEGYLGTELWRDHTHPHVYVTIDRWVSPAAYNAFADAHADEYERIDAKYAPMCVSETRLGDFDAVEA
jgi:heme-degrading monooxygenase HmoA